MSDALWASYVGLATVSVTRVPVSPVTLVTPVLGANVGPRAMSAHEGLCALAVPVSQILARALTAQYRKCVSSTPLVGANASEIGPKVTGVAE